MKNPLYSFTLLALKHVIFKNVKLDIKIEEPPPKSAAIVVSNHTHPWDPSLTVLALNKEIHFYTINFIFHTLLFKNKILRKFEELIFGGSLIGFYFRLIQQIPVDPKIPELNNKAFKKAVSFLKEGKYIGIFPEGMSAMDNKKTYYTGLINLLLRHNVPIVPVFVKCYGNPNYKGVFKPNFRKVKIRVGKSIKYKLPKKMQRKTKLLYIKKIMKTVYSLEAKDGT
jgi:1-acyl-sn-glycerol-3-phosphate acyltransferase